MATEFETYLHTHTALHAHAVAHIAAAASTLTLRRNELLLRPGEVCRHKTFVLTGLLRVYGTGTDGNEHIIQFSPQLTWTLEAESYDRQQPARFGIAAVERSELLQWTKPVFDRLLADIPELKTFSQQLITRTGHNSRQRLFAALGATPEEKYQEFARTSPELLARLPLHMVAAYLGMSLKTLTRVRRAQLRR